MTAINIKKINIKNNTNINEESNKRRVAKTSIKALSAIIMNISLIGSSFATGTSVGPVRSQEYTAKMTNAFALFAIGVGRQGGILTNGQAQALGSANAYFNDVNSKAQSSNDPNLRYLALMHAYLLLLKQDILRVEKYSATTVDPLILTSLLKAHEVNPNYTYDYDARLNNTQLVQNGLNNIKEAIDSIPMNERTQMDQSIGARTTLALGDTSFNDWTEERFLRHWNPDAPVVIILSPQAGPRTNDPTLIALCGAIGNLAHGIAERGELHERLKAICIDGLQSTDSCLGTNQVLIKLWETQNMLDAPAHENELAQKLFCINRVEYSLDTLQTLPIGELATRVQKIHRPDLVDYQARDLLRKIHNETLPCDTLRNWTSSMIHEIAGRNMLFDSTQNQLYSRFTVACNEAKAALENYSNRLNAVSSTSSNTNTQDQATGSPDVRENNISNNNDTQPCNRLVNTNNQNQVIGNVGVRENNISNNNDTQPCNRLVFDARTLRLYDRPSNYQVSHNLRQQATAQTQTISQNSDNSINPSRAESIAGPGGILPYNPGRNINLSAASLYANNSGIAAWREAHELQEERESLAQSANHTYDQSSHNQSSYQANDQGNIHTQPVNHTNNTYENNNSANNVENNNTENSIVSVQPLPTSHHAQIMGDAASNNNNNDDDVQSFSTVSSANSASTAQTIQSNNFVMIPETNNETKSNYTAKQENK